MFNTLIFLAFLGREQPPPRGCVLKPLIFIDPEVELIAAASARLCVETKYHLFLIYPNAAAASARLCVETITLPSVNAGCGGSRLRAAVC